MVIEGKLIEKFDTQEIKESFKKREFIVEYAENPQYPEFLKFELIQSNCEQIDNISPNEQIAVSFNLKGRKWTDPSGNVKYFNSLQAWRVDKKSENTADVPPPSATDDPSNWMQADNSGDDDLPF